jgi:hypothetical protein
MNSSLMRTAGVRNGEGRVGQVIWFGPSEQNASAAFLLARDFSNRYFTTAFSRFHCGGPNFQLTAKVPRGAVDQLRKLRS